MEQMFVSTYLALYLSIDCLSRSQLSGGGVRGGRRRGERWSPAPPVPSAVSGPSQDTANLVSSLRTASVHISESCSVQWHNMDLQLKENAEKEAGKINYGTNFNNFIKVSLWHHLWKTDSTNMHIQITKRELFLQ